MVFRIEARIRNEALRRLSAEIQRSVSDGLADWADAVLLEADRHVPTGATTDLKLSGERIPAEPTDWATVQYTVPYALYVHEGTRAHWPPPLALLRWVELVLGKAGQEAVRTEYLIRRKIARFGTKPNPWLRNAVDTIRPSVPGIFERRLEEAAERLAAGIR